MCLFLRFCVAMARWAQVKQGNQTEAIYSYQIYLHFSIVVGGKEHQKKFSTMTLKFGLCQNNSLILSNRN